MNPEVFLYKYGFLVMANMLIFAAVRTYNNESFIAVNIQKLLSFQKPSWRRALIVGITIPIWSAIMLTMIWNLMRGFENFMFYLYVFSTTTLAWEFITRFRIMERYQLQKIRPWTNWIPRNGKALIRIGLLSVTVFVIGNMWWLAPSWVTFDLTAVISAYTIISMFGTMRVRYLFALLLPIIAYDVWGVFTTKMIVEVAQGISFPIPGLIYVPQSPLDPLSPVVGGLGIGDVFYLGLAMSVAKYHNLYKWALLGFVVALLMTLSVCVMAQQALPATLFLNPLMLVSLLIGSLRTKRQLAW